MRIISRFHDYYDRAQAHGQDLSRIFVRQRVEYEAARRHKEPIPRAYHSMLELLRAPLERRTAGGARFRADTFLVGFCGKLYPGMRVSVEKDPTVLPEASFLYDFAQFEQRCLQYGIDLHDEEYLWARTTPAQRYEQFFALKGSTQLSGLLSGPEHAIVYASGIPSIQVMCGSRAHVEVNPCLKDLQFYRVFDAFAAFQELEMFLGNIALPSDTGMVQLPDAQRAAKHGFDQNSFRKPPEKGGKSKRR